LPTLAPGLQFRERLRAVGEVSLPTPRKTRRKQKRNRPACCLSWAFAPCRLARDYERWLGGLAALRRYHELPQWRSIWRQIEIAGVPEGMFSIDQ
jgi:hypothetical protein